MDGEPGTTPRASRNDLIPEDVFCLTIQLVSQFVDATNFILTGRLGRLMQKPPHRFGYERRPVIRDMVDLFRQLVRKSDLHAHRT